MEIDGAVDIHETGSKARAMRNGNRGGFRAAAFMLALSSLENIGFVANMVSLVLYFMKVMHFDLSGSSTTLTNFMGATFMLTLVGGFISDAYLTRLHTVLAFGFFEILGYVLVTIQAYEKKLRPDGECLTCQVEGGEAWMLYMSLCLLALGYGGVRGALPSLGADQFEQKHTKERAQLASFFNWFLLSATLGATLGVTVVSWLSSRGSWSLAFLVEMMLASLGFACVAAGRRFYRLRPPGDSPLLRVVQVIVLAVRNRKLALPERPDELYELDDAFSEQKIPHTDQFRFLDKAAITGHEELKADEDERQARARPCRKACSVTQVEEVKILLRMLPVLGSTILMNTCLAQLQTFSIHQGNTMDLHLGSFLVPPASIPIIPLLFMSILIPIYELAFVPLARRFTGHPSGITHLQRVGVGLVLSAVSMATAALVEIKRKNAFNRHQKQISLFWLSYQYAIFGVADMFTFVGLLEFFYSEAPARMRSLSAALSFLPLSLGYFVSTVFVNVVNSASGRANSSGQGWLQGLDLNRNHLERFYWLLALLSCLNFGVYLLCAKWYKYRSSPANPLTATQKEAAEEKAQESKEKVDEQEEEEEDNHDHCKHAMAEAEPTT